MILIKAEETCPDIETEMIHLLLPLSIAKLFSIQGTEKYQEARSHNHFKHKLQLTLPS